MLAGIAVTLAYVLPPWSVGLIVWFFTASIVVVLMFKTSVSFILATLKLASLPLPPDTVTVALVLYPSPPKTILYLTALSSFIPVIVPLAPVPDVEVNETLSLIECLAPFLDKVIVCIGPASLKIVAFTVLAIFLTNSSSWNVPCISVR